MQGTSLSHSASDSKHIGWGMTVPDPQRPIPWRPALVTFRPSNPRN
ncbi:hypothetical protein B0I32_14038 [Nonomuraea fuscirosea]|uniref:Uncharacterized protein n=1 Tax=Nonomuraea fuscirosea TaxID=1291556 RepID=A0A2T0LXP3_9ACTN|nr:hypothetical protein B0I32_14038 [Nonomuraea fuscirosea]